MMSRRADEANSCTFLDRGPLRVCHFRPDACPATLPWRYFRSRVTAEGSGPNQAAAKTAAQADFNKEETSFIRELGDWARHFRCPAHCPYKAISNVVGKDYDDVPLGFRTFAQAYLERITEHMAISVECFSTPIE